LIYIEQENITNFYFSPEFSLNSAVYDVDQEFDIQKFISELSEKPHDKSEATNSDVIEELDQLIAEALDTV
jgi:hypothetical protein